VKVCPQNTPSDEIRAIHEELLPLRSLQILLLQPPRDRRRLRHENLAANRPHGGRRQPFARFCRRYFQIAAFPDPSQRRAPSSSYRMSENGMDRPRSRPQRLSECLGGLSGEGAPPCLGTAQADPKRIVGFPAEVCELE
jgi:hypothetical protein